MESQTTSSGFQETLEPIRSIATSEAEKGHLFERLMKAYFAQDPLYRDRFAGVWLWSQPNSTRLRNVTYEAAANA